MARASQPAIAREEPGRSGRVTAWPLQSQLLKTKAEGGRFELPRAFDPGGFQDRCLKPGSATPPEVAHASRAPKYSD